MDEPQQPEQPAPEPEPEPEPDTPEESPAPSSRAVPETEASEQLNGVTVPGTWYGQTGRTLKQERPMPSPIPAGTMVQLHSLSTDELNGRVGECGALNAKKGRYSVALLGDGRTCGVRPANLCRPRTPSPDSARRSEKLADEGIAVLSAIRGGGGADPMAFIALNKTLTEAVELDPCCARAHQALGDACVFRDHAGTNKALNAAAIKHFRRAAENGGGHGARFALSGCLGRSGDLQGELAELRAILQVDPDNVMCACSLGRLHQYQERHEEALGELLRVLSSPEVPKGSQLGRISGQLAVTSAAALSREANAIAGDAGGGFVGPGMAFVPARGERALQLHEIALHTYKVALPHLLGSGPEICYANHASTLMDLGRCEDSAHAARQALQCHGSPGSLRSFAQHTIGRSSEAQGDEARVHGKTDDAVRHFESAKVAYEAVRLRHQLAVEYAVSV